MAPLARSLLRRAVLARGAFLRRQSTTRPLPEGLKEITRVPRTPAWSLAELHQEGAAALDHEHAVLNEEKLLELAELCHLHIDAAQLPSLLKDVESIIQCTKTIQAVTVEENIDDLYATGNVDLGIAPLREDVVTDGNYPEKVLANASERLGSYFKVPKVLQD